MKRSLLSAIWVLLIGTQWQPIKAQQVEWIKQIGGAFDETVYDMCYDPAGNLYMTGSLGAGGTVDGHSFSVNGTRDSFLAKFNAAMEYQWAITFGGAILPPTPNELDVGKVVMFNPVSGQIILGGLYADNGNGVVFGPGMILSGGGMFVAGYDTDGICQWVRSVPGGGAQDMVIDGGGNIYVQGFYEFSQFGYMVKYSSGGDELWYRDLGQWIVSAAWVADDDGTLAMVFSAYDGTTLIGTSIQPSTGAYSNPLFARMDTSATQLNGYKLMGTDSLGTFHALSMLGDGTFITSGGYRQNLFLPWDTLVAASGVSQPVLARLDSAGTPMWLQDFEANEVIYSAIPSTLAGDSSIYLGMDVSAPMTFGGFTVTPSTARDFVVARFDLDGNCLGVVQGGELANGRVNVHGTPDGGVIVSGPFFTSMNIGSGLTGTGSRDYFVAKYSQITSVPEQRSGADQSLHIYANPNDGTCTIDLPEGLEWTQALVLNIYDLNGRLVQSEPVGRHSGPLKLDIRAQARGSYPVELTDGAQRYSGTIVFE